MSGGYSTVGFPLCPRKSKGQIQVIFGPMFSGKTTELMRLLKRYKIANYKCLVAKYSKDIRYSDSMLATHDQQTIAATSTITLGALKDLAMRYEVIGVDEGQFFPDVVEFSEEMANQGKIVLVAALDGTYQRVGFGNILNLVPLAEHVIKLTAICMTCCGEASYTKRKTKETEIEVIGGADKYLAVCRACYHSPKKEDGQSPVPRCLTEKNKVAALPSPSKANVALFADPEAKENLTGAIIV